MGQRFRRRYLDLLGSIYIYNEHCGYTAIDRVLFERLCRVISLTEKRGHRQVEILPRHPAVSSHARLIKIFRIIEQDEPTHWAPYDDWLTAHARRTTSWWERAIDRLIHRELLVLKLPALFLNPWLGRRTSWPEAHDPLANCESRLLAAAS